MITLYKYKINVIIYSETKMKFNKINVKKVPLLEKYLTNSLIISLLYSKYTRKQHYSKNFLSIIMKSRCIVISSIHSSSIFIKSFIE